MRPDEFYRLFGLELRRTARDPLTWIGLVAFIAVTVAGAVLYWRTLPPRPEGGRLFGEAYMLAIIISWHAGFARDRMVRFDVFLVANFVTPRSLYFAKIAAALCFVAALSVIAFLAALAASAGDVQYAGKSVTLCFLASLLALPALVVIELAFNTRYPVPILLLLFLAFLAVYNRMGDVQALSRALGLDGNIALVPAILRSVVALGVSAAVYPLFRMRLGGPRLAAMLDSP